VELEEIEHVATQAFERPVRRSPHAGRIEAAARGLGGHLGEDQCISAFERGTHELLRAPAAVDLGRVDPGDTFLESRSDRIDRLFVRGIRPPAHAPGLPGAEADHRYLGPRRAQLLQSHRFPLARSHSPDRSMTPTLSSAR
jgi:hypothetical protein